MATRQTLACEIPKKVKNAVWERDGHKCILCGSYQAMPNAHYIARSHGGLGTEENIVTLCANCHFAYDNSYMRKELKTKIRDYLMSKYPRWNEEKLIYKKYGGKL